MNNYGLCKWNFGKSCVSNKNIEGFRDRKYKSRTKKVSHRALEMDLEGGRKVFCSVQKQLKYGYTNLKLLPFE